MTARIRSSALAMTCLAAAGCLPLGEDREARGSVVENEIAGRVFEGAEPSVGARIRVYPAGEFSPHPIAELRTDSVGAYRIELSGSGPYSLLADREGLLLFVDGLEARLPGADVFRSDTLKETGRISVRVQLEGGADASSIVGEVLGSPFDSHADSTGDMSMSGMPAAPLRIRIYSESPGYDTLLVPVTVPSGDSLDLGYVELPRLESASP